MFAELPATPGLPRAADYVSAAPPHADRLNSCRPGHGTAPMPGGAVAGRPGRRRRSRGGRSGRVADSGPRQDTAVFLNACRSADGPAPRLCRPERACRRCVSAVFGQALAQVTDSQTADFVPPLLLRGLRCLNTNPVQIRYRMRPESMAVFVEIIDRSGTERRRS